MARGSKGNAARPMAMGDEHASVSVRPISNGFVSSHSSSGAKGYQHTETYHPTKPQLSVSVGAGKGGKASAKPAAKSAAKPAPTGKGAPSKAPAKPAHPSHQRYR